MARVDEILSSTFEFIKFIDETKKFADLSLVKQVVERAKSAGIDRYHIAELIKATQNAPYIKECVEKASELGIYLDDKVSLIIATHDSEYIKNWIRNDSELSSKRLLDIYRYNLIMATNDIAFIKECIEDAKLLGIHESDRVELIINTNDIEYIKSCIEKYKFTSSYNKANLIVQTKDTEYIKDCIERANELELSETDVMWLVEETEDKEYIKDWIENRSSDLRIESKLQLIQATHDTDYIKKCVEEKAESLGLMSDDKIALILFMHNIPYIKECVEEMAEQLGFGSIEQFFLIREIEDEKYIKACIEQRNPVVRLDAWARSALVESLEDDEYREECLERAEEFGLVVDGQVILMSDDKKVAYMLKKLDEEMTGEELGFNLPEEITIGIEIESEGPWVDFMLKRPYLDGWELTEDGTLISGLEMVSPILSPKENDAKEIYRVNRMLKAIGQQTSNRCGGHVHIGSDYLTSEQSYLNLMAIWCNTEQILYAISNEKGTAPRTGIFSHASPVTRKFQVALEKGSINLTDESDLDNFIHDLKSIQETRYTGLNFLNINDSKNTIEFRLANGTLNPDLWIDNINLFGGIVAVSEELTKTEAKEKIELFLKLQSDASEEEKLTSLLQLIGVFPDRYIERYKNNMPLIKEGKTQEAFSDIKGSTRISSTKIREMIEKVSASSQLDAMENVIKEIEKEEQRVLDGNLQK